MRPSHTHFCPIIPYTPVDICLAHAPPIHLRMKKKNLTTQINIRLSSTERRMAASRARKRGFTSASSYVRYLIAEDEAKRAAIDAANKAA